MCGEDSISLGHIIKGPATSNNVQDGTSITEFIIPKITENHAYFMTRPCNGCQNTVARFPQFNVMNTTTFFKKNPRRIFGIPSRYETLELKLCSPYNERMNEFGDDSDDDDAAANLLSEYGNIEKNEIKIENRASMDVIRTNEMTRMKYLLLTKKLNYYSKKNMFIQIGHMCEATIVRIETEEYNYTYSKDNPSDDSIYQ